MHPLIVTKNHNGCRTTHDCFGRMSIQEINPAVNMQSLVTDAEQLDHVATTDRGLERVKEMQSDGGGDQLKP